MSNFIKIAQLLGVTFFLAMSIYRFLKEFTASLKLSFFFYLLFFFSHEGKGNREGMGEETLSLSLLERMLFLLIPQTSVPKDET